MENSVIKNGQCGVIQISLLQCKCTTSYESVVERKNAFTHTKWKTCNFTLDISFIFRCEPVYTSSTRTVHVFQSMCTVHVHVCVSFSNQMIAIDYLNIRIETKPKANCSTASYKLVRCWWLFHKAYLQFVWFVWYCCWKQAFYHKNITFSTDWQNPCESATIPQSTKRKRDRNVNTEINILSKCWLIFCIKIPPNSIHTLYKSGVRLANFYLVKQMIFAHIFSARVNAIARHNINVTINFNCFDWLDGGGDGDNLPSNIHDVFFFFA